LATRSNAVRRVRCATAHERPRRRRHSGVTAAPLVCQPFSRVWCPVGQSVHDEGNASPVVSVRALARRTWRRERYVQPGAEEAGGRVCGRFCPATSGNVHVVGRRSSRAVQCASTMPLCILNQQAMVEPAGGGAPGGENCRAGRERPPATPPSAAHPCGRRGGNARSPGRKGTLERSAAGEVKK